MRVQGMGFVLLYLWICHIIPCNVVSKEKKMNCSRFHPSVPAVKWSQPESRPPPARSCNAQTHRWKHLCRRCRRTSAWWASAGACLCHVSALPGQRRVLLRGLGRHRGVEHGQQLCEHAHTNTALHLLFTEGRKTICSAAPRYCFLRFAFMANGSR